MTINDFRVWLDRYDQAWMSRDPDAAVELFTADAVYHETPFDPPLVGSPAIHRYWSEGAQARQREVRFEATPLAIESESDAAPHRATGTARWHATFRRVPSHEFVELDGILSARFAAPQRCSEFREWWHRREREPAPSPTTSSASPNTEVATFDLAAARLRVARPSDDLVPLVAFYRDGLGFDVISQFQGHDGIDGVMLGRQGTPYHLEFTHTPGHSAGRAPSPDHLLVFYIPNRAEWNRVVERLRRQGHEPVKSFNPYWDQLGKTFADPDGYRVVLQNAAWPK